MRVFVKNNKAFLRGLDTFEKRVEGKVKDAVHEWAIDTEVLAKSRVPKDTGALQASINADTEKEGWVWKVGTPIHYGPYVEFGTGTLVDIPNGVEDYASQFKGKGIREVNLPARPYLFNSGREKFNELVQKLKKDFGK